MREQRFHKDDLVRVADDLGPGMSHFTSGCDAIVVGSYADKHGGDCTWDYSLLLRDEGEVAWYSEHQLTLIDRSRADIRTAWIAALDDRFAQESDLEWIFSHGQEVIERWPSASLQALWACLFKTSMCGARGEGVVYDMNARALLSHAAPFLFAGDRPGWTAYCAALKVKLQAGGRRT